MDIQYLEISPGAAAKLSVGIVQVYAAAFGQPPYLRGEPETKAFADVFSRQLSRQGFRCIVAREGSHGALVGFVYGFTCQPGQWWHDQVIPHMNAAQRKRWLSYAFELTELAVLPSYQGNGIGGQLHDRVLSGLLQRTAVLSTMQTETSAMALYRKRGWQTLLTNFLFSGAARLYVILGKDLPPLQRN
jgi:ribosomal protein S18 acetylase RimI-like enzyme